MKLVFTNTNDDNTLGIDKERRRNRREVGKRKEQERQERRFSHGSNRRRGKNPQA